MFEQKWEVTYKGECLITFHYKKVAEDYIKKNDKDFFCELILEAIK